MVRLELGDGYWSTLTQSFWCSSLSMCYYRARIRLGIPPHVAREFLAKGM